MRPPSQLVDSRARVRQRYALFPLEGYPPSRIPGWADCEARVLASPALGAAFAQYLFDVPRGKGKGRSEADHQVFGYVLAGGVRVEVAGDTHDLKPGGFFYVPERQEWSLNATEASKLL